MSKYLDIPLFYAVFRFFRLVRRRKSGATRRFIIKNAPVTTGCKSVTGRSDLVPFNNIYFINYARVLQTPSAIAAAILFWYFSANRFFASPSLLIKPHSIRTAGAFVCFKT